MQVTTSHASFLQRLPTAFRRKSGTLRETYQALQVLGPASLSSPFSLYFLPQNLGSSSAQLLVDGSQSHASLCPHTHAVLSVCSILLSIVYLINPTQPSRLGAGIRWKPILSPFLFPNGRLGQASHLCSQSTLCKLVTAFVTPSCNYLSLLSVSS